MLRRSLAALWTAAAAASLGAGPAAEPKKETIEATVLATAKDYAGKGSKFLAIKGFLVSEDRMRELEHVAQGGYTLLHASAAGGMKVLASSGTWSFPTRRISYGHRRILGTAADEERLYVVLWESSGRVWDRAPAADAKLKDGRYILTVFELREGYKVEELAIKGPESPTAETLDKGPLAVGENQVTLYGETYKFKGGHLVK